MARSTKANERVKVVVTPLTPSISSRKYVVAPSADATPPTLIDWAAVKETLLVGGREVGRSVGIEKLGMVIPEGREKLGMEAEGIEVGTGRTSVMAALEPRRAGRCVQCQSTTRRRQNRDAPNTEKPREISAENFMFDTFGGKKEARRRPALRSL